MRLAGFWLAAIALSLLLACTPARAELSSPPAPSLRPLIVDPPETAQAARPSVATYATYQGVVCGVVPRPEHGYTVRYPKIWLAREQGSLTWLADNTDDLRLVGVVVAEPIPADLDDLEQALVRGWSEADLAELRLERVAEATVGGQPAVRFALAYSAPDGTPMAGYTTAAVVDGRLYRVEVAIPATRYERLGRAADILAAQLLLSPSSAEETP